jgi:hypothetical protein
MERAAIRICLFLIAAAASAAPAAAYLDMSAAQTMYATNGNIPQTTGTVGGSGGSALYEECGSAQGAIDYLQGIRADYGNWIDAVGLICAKPQENRGALSLIQPFATATMWGGRGGTADEDHCAPDEGIGGLRLQRSPNNFVGYIVILCRPLNDLASLHPSGRSFGRISNKSPPIQDVTCPDGMIATALFGGWGVYVDRLGLGCLPPPKAVHETIISGMEDNTDRPGTDYRAFSTNGNPASCQNDCFGYAGKCLAWTYVRPGLQGPDAMCHLKNAAPATVANECCISGTVRTPQSVFSEPQRSNLIPQQYSPFSEKVGTREVRTGTSDHGASALNRVGEPGGIAAMAPAMTGIFNTDFGELILGANGGTYSVNGGGVHIERIYGDFMDGTWTQATAAQKCSDGTYHGHFRFRFNPRGFTGSYGYCEGAVGAGQWNGTRRAN